MRSLPGWCPSRPPVTEEGRRAPPPASAASSVTSRRSVASRTRGRARSHSSACSGRSRRPSTTPHFSSTSRPGPTTAIAAHCPRRSRSTPRRSTRSNVRGLRVAWSIDLGFAIVDPEVAAITRKAADVLVEAGQLEEVDAEVSFPESLDVYSKLGDVDTWIDLPEGLWPERADELDPQLIAGYEKGDRLTVRKFATTFTRRHAIEAQARGAVRRDRRPHHADRGHPRVSRRKDRCRARSQGRGCIRRWPSPSRCSATSGAARRSRCLRG